MATNGVCSNLLNTCVAGTFQQVTDSANFIYWNCVGINGGSIAQCSIAAPQYSYTWATSEWTICVNGSQTRTSACKRNDGVTSDVSFCSGYQPITFQTCSIVTPPVNQVSCSGSVQCQTSDGGQSCTTPSCPVGCRAVLADVTDNYNNITHVNGGRALRGTNCDA